MVAFGELTLRSDLRFQVEIHSIQSDAMGRIHGGKFKNHKLLKEQLAEDAKHFGSWQDIQAMSIEFEYNNTSHKYSILTPTPISDIGIFKVISENNE